ncbi:MAG: DUF2029 domain-containing protein [Bdellovibrionales bacterium]|nr:DUF2029 domain-containing protein [Bdellovibrionales bacterium]
MILRLRGPQLATLAILLLVATSALSRQWNSDGNDFAAFFSAGQRILHGLSPFALSDATPYKYAPVSALLFVPFALLPYSAARLLYLGIHLLCTLALPFCLWQWLSPLARRRSIDATFAWALAGALVGSLRFLDNEFTDSQVNIVSLACVLLGAQILHSARTSTREHAGAALWSFGALFKFHPLLAGELFCTRRTRPSLWLVPPLIALLPSLAWWRDFWQLHTQKPVGDSTFSTILQGLKPLFFQLGFSPHTQMLAYLASALVLGAAYLWWIPKRPAAPNAYWCALLSLLCLGTTLSPIPWQHTYVILWPALFVGLVTANAPERRRLWICALLLGLSPRGILGPLAHRLEQAQIVFWLTLAVSFTLLRMSRRMASPAEKR